jgi:hypothetical protein
MSSLEDSGYADERTAADPEALERAASAARDAASERKADDEIDQRPGHQAVSAPPGGRAVQREPSRDYGR